MCSYNWSSSIQLSQHLCSHVTMFWALGNQLTRWLQFPKVTCSSFVTFSAIQAKSGDKLAGKITGCLGKSQQPLPRTLCSCCMGSPHTFTYPPPHCSVPLHTLCAPSPYPKASTYLLAGLLASQRQLSDCFSMTLVMGSCQEVARNVSLNNPQTLLNSGKEDCWDCNLALTSWPLCLVMEILVQLSSLTGDSLKLWCDKKSAYFKNNKIPPNFKFKSLLPYYSLIWISFQNITVNIIRSLENIHFTFHRIIPIPQ